MSIDRNRVEDVLNKAPELRLAVLGDCMLDVYLTGAVGRISPEAPVPVVQVRGERVAPGGAANVAAAVVALGARCELVGVVGEDDAAGRLAAVLEQFGVGGDHLIVAPDRETTTKTRVMARHQHVVRFDRETEEDISEGIADQIIGTLEELADSVDAIILQDYNKGVLVPAVIRSAIDVARRRGIPSIADPKFRRFFDYQGAHVFKPNASELSAALGVPEAPRDRDGLRRARERLGCNHLLVTLAEEGMLLLGTDDTLHRISAVTRDVFDVSGAGDTVTAVTATCLAAGATVYESAVVANYAAGIEVSKTGVVPVRREEVLLALQGT